MLIFVKGHYLPLIASGQKTSTIRPWKVCRLRPGGTLVFNGKITTVITQVEQRRLGDLTAADIKADGFASRADFERAFHEHYPASTPNTVVWILRFHPPHSRRANATSSKTGPT